MSNLQSTDEHVSVCVPLPRAITSDKCVRGTVKGADGLSARGGRAKRRTGSIPNRTGPPTPFPGARAKAGADAVGSNVSGSSDPEAVPSSFHDTGTSEVRMAAAVGGRPYNPPPLDRTRSAKLGRTRRCCVRAKIEEGGPTRSVAVAAAGWKNYGLTKKRYPTEEIAPRPKRSRRGQVVETAVKCDGGGGGAEFETAAKEGCENVVYSECSSLSPLNFDGGAVSILSDRIRSLHSERAYLAGRLATAEAERDSAFDMRLKFLPINNAKNSVEIYGSRVAELERQFHDEGQRSKELLDENRLLKDKLEAMSQGYQRACRKVKKWKRRVTGPSSFEKVGSGTSSEKKISSLPNERVRSATSFDKTNASSNKTGAHSLSPSLSGGERSQNPAYQPRQYVFAADGKDQFYEAVILNVRCAPCQKGQSISVEWEYRVHYCGWKSRWDKWVQGVELHPMDGWYEQIFRSKRRAKTPPSKGGKGRVAYDDSSGEHYMIEDVLGRRETEGGGIEYLLSFQDWQAKEWVPAKDMSELALANGKEYEKRSKLTA